MAKEKLIKLYKEFVLTKIFNDPSVPTQKVSDCVALPKLMTKNNVFIDIKDLLTKSKKMLLLGDAGNGKSTLIAKLMNLWANGELPQFEFAFDINLKLLLSDKWNTINSVEADDNPLAYFIYSILKQSITHREDRISFEEIKQILDNPLLRGKILFAVDGLDSVSQLLNKQDHIAKEIINEIFTREYFLATSRPNVLSTMLENHFSEKIEVTGLNSDGVILHVHNYYSSQSEHLLKLATDYFDNNEHGSGNDLISHLSASIELFDLEAMNQLQRVESFINIAADSSYSFKHHADVIKAIESYYRIMEADLLSLLKNPSIAKMAESPLMLMMILVLSEAQGSGKIDPRSTADVIFQKILILMGKIYENPTGGDIRAISDERSLALKEISILKEIAYEALKNGGQLKGSIIDSIISHHVPEGSRYNIVNFYSFGALRVVDNQDLEFTKIAANDLLRKDHAIIHISFQSYLAACSLIERLSSEDKDIYMEAANFIAYNRNDSQYLTLFKFMAAMLAKDDSSQDAINRFWEAIQCNLNFVFEIGDRKKAILLMNLIKQAEKDGVIDSRIPNLDAVVKFIDDVVLENFHFWKDEINKSGYWSKEMKNHFWKVIEKNIPATEFNLADNFNAGEEHKISSRISSFASSISDEAKESSMIEMAGMIMNNIDVSRLLRTLLKNIEGNRNWEIIESSMNVIIKIITFKPSIISHEDMSYILSKTQSYINDGELKGCATNVLKVLIEVYKNDASMIKSILTSLLQVFKQGLDNTELYQLIKNVILSKDDEMIEIYLDTFIPLIQDKDNLMLHKDYSHSISILPLSRSFSSNYNPNKIFDLALEMIIELIQAGNVNMANMALDRLASILYTQGDANGNLANALGKILAVSGSSTQKMIFERIMSNISKDTIGGIQNLESTNTGVITAINSVLNTGVTIKTEFAAEILSALSLLLKIEHDKLSVIDAISKIASIATVIKPAVGQELLLSLSDISATYPSAYIAIAMVAKDAEEIVIKQALDILFNVLDLGGVDLVSEPLKHLTSGNIPSSLASVMVNKLMPIVYRGVNGLGISLANLLAKDNSVFADERSNFVDGLIGVFHKSKDVELHKNSALEIYIICKNNAELKPIIINALIDLLKSSKFAEHTQLNKEIKTNFISLLSKITGSVDDQLSQEIFSLYRVILNENNCDGQVLKDAIGELAAINQEMAHFITDSLLKVESENPIIISTAIHALGKIAAKKILDSEKTNLFVNKLIDNLSNPDLSLSILYILNKILKISETSHSLLNKIPLLLTFAMGETKLAIYAIGIISKIAEREQVEDDVLSQILIKINYLLVFDHEKTEVIEALPKIIGAMSLNNAVKLLKEGSSDIREVAIKKVTQKIIEEDLSKAWKGRIINMLRELSAFDSSEAWQETIKNILTIARSNLDAADIVTTKAEYAEAAEKIKYFIKQINPKNDYLQFLEGSFAKVNKNELLELMKIVVSAVSDSNIAGVIDKSFANIFKTKLDLLIEELNNSWAENLENMIEIIGDDSEIENQNLKKLVEYAVKRIQFLIEEMDEDEVNLLYIKDKFSHLVGVAGEVASQIMEQVIHSLLEDKIITINEREYIVKAINEFNLTLSISTIPASGQSPVTFVIAFGNKIYHLYGEENRVNIDYIANTVLQSDKGILAEQYIKNEAVFYNSESAIKRAAVDVKDCKGLITNEQLEINQWQASWIYSSNDQKYYPDSAALLLFIREIGGYFIGYKITSSITGEISINTHKQHPEQIDEDFREEIFGLMEHDDDKAIKARVYSHQISISYEQGFSLIDGAKGLATNLRAEFASSGLVRSVFQLNNWVPNIGMRLSNGGTIVNVDKSDRKKMIKALYSFAQKYIPDLDQFVTSSWTTDSKNTNIKVHGRELVGEFDHRNSRDLDAAQYSKQVKKNTEAKNELREILTSPVQEGCYYELIRCLNEVYSAAEVIRSGWIKSEKQGDVAKIGGAVLSTASSILAPVVPGVGMITSFLNKILNGLDLENQKRIIENIYRFARDGSKMNIIVENIARKISLNLDSIDVDSMDRVIKTYLDTLVEALEGGIEGLVVSAVVAVKNSRESKNAKTIAIEDGEKLAVIIAQYIIKKISDGVYVNDNFFNREEHMAVLVINDVIINHRKPLSLAINPLEVDEIEFEDDESHSPDARVNNGVPIVEVGCGGRVSKSSNAAVVDGHSKRGIGCIIMRVEVVRTMFDDRMEAIASLASKEEKIDALKKYGNPQNIENESILLQTKLGMKLLYQAKAIYGEEGYSRISNLYEDAEISELILDEAKYLSIDNILDMLLIGLAKLESESVNLLRKSSDVINLLDLNHGFANENNLPLVSYNEDRNFGDIDSNLFIRYREYLSSALHIFDSFTSKIIENVAIRSYLLNYVYKEDIAGIYEILSQEYIRSSGVIGIKDILKKSPFEWTKKDFGNIYKAVHTDKGGSGADFIKIRSFQENIINKDNLKHNLFTQAFEKISPSIQKLISKATYGFKIIDTATDGTRFVYIPNFYNAKALLLDSTYLYSMHVGVNGYSSIINLIDVSYKLYQGEYVDAMQQLTTVAAYTALPIILAVTGVPFIGVLYSSAILGYTGYASVSNIYSFYKEYNADDFNIKSYAAYKDIAIVLSESYLQSIYDFKIIAAEYEEKLSAKNTVYNQYNYKSFSNDPTLDITGITNEAENII